MKFASTLLCKTIRNIFINTISLPVRHVGRLRSPDKPHCDEKTVKTMHNLHFLLASSFTLSCSSLSRRMSIYESDFVIGCCDPLTTKE